MKTLTKLTTIMILALLFTILFPAAVFAAAVEPNETEILGIEDVDAQLVGVSRYRVGNGVSAYYETSDGSLYFTKDSDGSGVLPEDWTTSSGYTVPLRKVKSVYISYTSPTVYFPADTSGMFAECENLVSVDLTGADFSYVQDASKMFFGCENLESVDMGAVPAGVNLRTTANMFAYCFSLTHVDLECFDTSYVENMNGMFMMCDSLTSLNLESLDMGEVSDSANMFLSCDSLTVLKTPHGNLRALALPIAMYNSSGTKYTSVPAKSKSMTLLAEGQAAKGYAAGTNVTAFFDSSTGTVTLDEEGDGTLWREWRNLCGFDREEIKSIKTASGDTIAMPVNSAELFAGCTNLTNINVNYLDSDDTKNMEGLFRNCSSVEELVLYKLDCFSVRNMSYMFENCTALKDINLNYIETDCCETMEGMFLNCSSLVDISDTREFRTWQVENMSRMFAGCKTMTWLNLSSFEVNEVTDSTDMFDGMSSLLTITTPKSIGQCEMKLPVVMYDVNGNEYEAMPESSIRLATSLILAQGGFSDVQNPNDWYYNAVYWAVANNVTSGMGEGTFQPLADLSRAQTVMFLYKLAGLPGVESLPDPGFKDVTSDNWYYNAVKWAVAKGITSGYGTGTFQPDVTCNRAMIVTFLMRYSKLAGTYAAPTTSASFSDVTAKDWFKDAVDWAVASGVTTGYGSGTFQPMRTCNRAMMVTFLKRVAELPKVS